MPAGDRAGVETDLNGYEGQSHAQYYFNPRMRAGHPRLPAVARTAMFWGCSSSPRLMLPQSRAVFNREEKLPAATISSCTRGFEDYRQRQGAGMRSRHRRVAAAATPAAHGDTAASWEGAANYPCLPFALGVFAIIWPGASGSRSHPSAPQPTLWMTRNRRARTVKIAKRCVSLWYRLGYFAWSMAASLRYHLMLKGSR